MTEVDDDLTARLIFNPDLFEAATVSRTLEHLQTLLESKAADPEQRISELPLPAEAERPATGDITSNDRWRGQPARPARAEGRPTRFR
jgi:non-ribosomal peptide synthetase component F